jgi:hypothetical protein
MVNVDPFAGAHALQKDNECVSIAAFPIHGHFGHGQDAHASTIHGASFHGIVCCIVLASKNYEQEPHLIKSHI